MIGGVALTLTNIVPIFMLLIVPKDKVEHNQKTKKHLIIFYTLGFIFMFLAILLTIGSLGIYLSDIYQYPEYTVLKKISLFEFIDRIENFIYIKWILSSFICLSLVIYYINHSIKKNSKKLFPTIMVSRVVKALTPYATIYFSAQIINALVSHQQNDDIWFWVLLTISSGAVLSILNAVFLRMETVELEVFYLKKEKIFSDKMFSLDFADIDKPETHDLRSKIRQVGPMSRKSTS